MRQITQIFVAFSEKLNFMHKQDETTITDLRDSPTQELSQKTQNQTITGCDLCTKLPYKTLFYIAILNVMRLE